VPSVPAAKFLVGFSISEILKQIRHPYQENTKPHNSDNMYLFKEEPGYKNRKSRPKKYPNYENMKPRHNIRPLSKSNYPNS
jgi:hypothetical protein